MLFSFSQSTDSLCTADSSWRCICFAKVSVSALLCYFVFNTIILLNTVICSDSTIYIYVGTVKYPITCQLLSFLFHSSYITLLTGLASSLHPMVMKNGLPLLFSTAWEFRQTIGRARRKQTPTLQTTCSVLGQLLLSCSPWPRSHGVNKYSHIYLRYECPKCCSSLTRKMLSIKTCFIKTYIVRYTVC